MLNIGYTFKNAALLEEALTAPACRIDQPHVQTNQRLEFLGDAVLGMLAAEMLYRAFPQMQEGELTIRRTHLVSTAALCAAAERLGLATALKQNRGAAPLSKNAKTLADAVEALMGAAYMDGGFDAARAVFAALALEVQAETSSWSRNAKGELQIRTQAMNPPSRPIYELVSTAGKAHEPIFTVRVSVAGVGSAVATASSRKRAETEAAQELLNLMDQRKR